MASYSLNQPLSALLPLQLARIADLPNVGGPAPAGMVAARPAPAPPAQNAPFDGHQNVLIDSTNPKLTATYAGTNEGWFFSLFNAGDNRGGERLLFSANNSTTGSFQAYDKFGGGLVFENGNLLNNIGYGRTFGNNVPFTVGAGVLDNFVYIEVDGVIVKSIDFVTNPDVYTVSTKDSGGNTITRTLLSIISEMRADSAQRRAGPYSDFGSNSPTNVRTGPYVPPYPPLTFVSTSFSSTGIAEAVMDYYVANDDFFDIEILAGDGVTSVVSRSHAVVVDYPQTGRVRLRAAAAPDPSRRGFPMQIKVTQATSGATLTKKSVIWTAPASFAINPTESSYFYFNAPTANKNTGSWRNSIFEGNETQPLLDSSGSPMDAAFSTGKKPSMYLSGPKVSGQRVRLQVTGSMTGVDIRPGGDEASASNISAVQTAGGESWIDFNWSWDQAKYLRKTGFGTDSYLLWIAPQFASGFSGRPYSNVRLYEIDGSGNRLSPGHWDVDHIAELSRYSPFQFGLRFMDMMAAVHLSGVTNPRITQAGDIGQQIPHSVPDLLNLLTVTGNTGRFHVPLQATETWIRTEARRTAVWAKMYNKPVMWALSNEVWNAGQAAWGVSAALGRQAVANGVYPQQPGDNGDNGFALRYWSYRNKQVMIMITEEFAAEGVAHLLRRVMELQNDNPGNNDAVVKSEPGNINYVDAIAVAPYTGSRTGNDLSGTDTLVVGDRIRALIPDVFAKAAIHRDYALGNGLGFFEYEGAFENIENPILWHNLLASQDGYDLVKFLVSEHKRIVGGNQMFYATYRPDTWGLSNFIGQTAELPADRPSMFMRAWHEEMAIAAA